MQSAVRSTPGQGTIVDVYLPALPGGCAERAGPAEGGARPRGAAFLRPLSGPVSQPSASLGLSALARRPPIG